MSDYSKRKRGKGAQREHKRVTKGRGLRKTSKNKSVMRKRIQGQTRGAARRAVREVRAA